MSEPPRGVEVVVWVGDRPAVLPLWIAPLDGETVVQEGDGRVTRIPAADAVAVGDEAVAGGGWPAGWVEVGVTTEEGPA